MSHILILIITTLLLIPGLMLVVIPGIPGLLYMLAVTLIYGFIDHFTHLTLGNFGIIALIVGIAMAFETSAGIIGAKWGGAHWTSLFYGVLGLIIGTILIPIPLVGGIIGLFFGILGAEYCRTSDMKKAGKAAMWGMGGSLVSIVANEVAAVAVITLFTIFAWR